jgi:hypothetical protein
MPQTDRARRWHAASGPSVAPIARMRPQSVRRLGLRRSVNFSAIAAIGGIVATI